MSIDLHQHSTFSDGVSSLVELVQRAKSRSVTAMALTDHDTIAGLEECARLAAEAQVQFLPGVEFEASEGPHVLGYFGGLPGPAVVEASEYYRAFKTRALKTIIQKLQAVGFSLDQEAILLRAGAGTPSIAHIVAEMFELGTLSSQDRGNAEFSHYSQLVGPQGLAPVPDHSNCQWPVRRLVEMLRASGAVAVLAHPEKKHCGLWPEMIEAGLQGVEAYNRHSHVRGDTTDFVDLAKDYRLIVTGGWDFHGDPDANGVARFLGMPTCDLTGFAPPDELLGPLLDQLEI